jgi:hypothetical protein
MLYFLKYILLLSLNAAGCGTVFGERELLIPYRIDRARDAQNNNRNFPGNLNPAAFSSRGRGTGTANAPAYCLFLFTAYSTRNPSAGPQNHSAGADTPYLSKAKKQQTVRTANPNTALSPSFGKAGKGVFSFY